MKTKRIKALLHLGGFYKGAWFILPADAESYERMVEQMAKAAMKHFAHKNGAKRYTAPTESTRGYARAELRAIGIVPPRTGKGRK